MMVQISYLQPRFLNLGEQDVARVTSICKTYIHSSVNYNS